MSVSSDMSNFKFDVFSDTDYAYDMEQVDNKLGEWAKKVELLEDDSKVLRALRQAGVDNWEGWGDAMDSLERE